MSVDAISVSALRARNLASADSNGFSDPYAVFTIGSFKKKTKTIKKDLNPEWNETFSFVPDNESILAVTVFDWDVASADDFLGYVEIDLNTVVKDESEIWFQLGQRKSGKKEKVSGDICLSFKKGVVSDSDNVAIAPFKPSGSVIENLRDKIQQCIQNKSSELDLLGCELPKIPKVVEDNLTHITNINLGFNKFITIPDMKVFNQLQVLDLTGNLITNIPPSISNINTLIELHLNGNKIDSIPEEITYLSKLEKLFLSNNNIKSITPNFGKLRKLDELALNGNPISEIPPSIGCCEFIEVMDLSCCELSSLPGEITYLTRLMELNIATNQLKALPNSMGRMTRLVVLNISDNQLTDLPISLGLCSGLAKFGAGINLERNPIKDPRMLEKYRVGPDHMVDFLEKRLALSGPVQLDTYTLPKYDQDSQSRSGSGIGSQTRSGSGLRDSQDLKTPSHTSALSTSATNLRQSQEMEDKLNALRKWGNTTIQQELRPKVTELQSRVIKSNDLTDVVKVAQFMKALKPEMEAAKLKIAPIDIPEDGSTPDPTSKLEQLKFLVKATLVELSLILRGIQKVMETNEVIPMIQLIKKIKTVFDTNLVN